MNDQITKETISMDQFFFIDVTIVVKIRDLTYQTQLFTKMILSREYDRCFYYHRIVWFERVLPCQIT